MILLAVLAVHIATAVFMGENLWTLIEEWIALSRDLITCPSCFLKMPLAMPYPGIFWFAHVLVLPVLYLGLFIWMVRGYLRARKIKTLTAVTAALLASALVCLGIYLFVPRPLPRQILDVKLDMPVQDLPQTGIDFQKTTKDQAKMMRKTAQLCGYIISEEVFQPCLQGLEEDLLGAYQGNVKVGPIEKLRIYSYKQQVISVSASYERDIYKLELIKWLVNDMKRKYGPPSKEEGDFSEEFADDDVILVYRAWWEDNDTRQLLFCLQGKGKAGVFVRLGWKLEDIKAWAEVERAYR